MTDSKAPPKASNDDPRFRNELPEANSINDYLGSYAKRLSAALAMVKPEELEKAFRALDLAAKGKKRIYSAGNGGSAAIADHLCCDFTKGTFSSGRAPLRTQSLASNTAMTTALANDCGYEQVFSWQIDAQGEPGDVVILISSSGNSPNIIKAAKSAKQRKMLLIGLSGFEGGELAAIADISLHVPVKNYGLAEDAHQVLMHVLTQYLAKTWDAQR